MMHSRHKRRILRTNKWTEWLEWEKWREKERERFYIFNGRVRTIQSWLQRRKKLFFPWHALNCAHVALHCLVTLCLSSVYTHCQRVPSTCYTIYIFIWWISCDNVIRCDDSVAGKGIYEIYVRTYDNTRPPICMAYKLPNLVFNNNSTAQHILQSIQYDIHSISFINAPFNSIHIHQTVPRSQIADVDSNNVLPFLHDVSLLHFHFRCIQQIWNEVCNILCFVREV